MSFSFNPSGLPTSSSSGRLRAAGNLSYLDFIRLLNKLWSDSIGFREDGVTLRVPFQATNTALSDPDYPLIVYSLEMRRPFPQEPKPKHREIINDNGNPIIIRGQRFENLVKFAVLDRVAPSGAERAEEILDTFEDFMLQMTPIFKELGISDLFYARRTADGVGSRLGTDVVERSVIYQVVTEKIILIDTWKLNAILISARIFLEDNQPHATPNTVPLGSVVVEVDDQMGSAVPMDDPDTPIDDPDTTFP